jgi:hypothetical protein
VVVSDDIRRQLASLGVSRKTRTTVFTAARPTDWNPTATLHPATGEPFTPDGAWEFVCGLISQGVEIETMVLDKPPGRTGYVIKCDGHGGETIYIKLQLGSGQVIGRSFHHNKFK